MGSFHGYFAETVASLADGATVSLDASSGNIFRLNASGNRTIDIPTNPSPGQMITIRHKAVGGSRTLSLTAAGPGSFRFGADIAGLSATSAQSADYIGCTYNVNDNRWDVISYVKGYLDEYNLTQSAHIEKPSSQLFERADNADLSLTTTGTLELWVKFNSFTGTTQDLIMKQEGGGSYLGYRFYLDSASTSIRFVAEDGSGTDVGVSWAPSLNTWYHVAVTIDSNVAKFYVDGAQQGANQTSSDAGDGSVALGIGGDPGSTSATNCNANFSLVRIWNGEARSQSEIMANMCIVLGPTANLVAEWTLNNTLNDNSGNGYTLTNDNGVTFQSDLPTVCAS